MLPQAVDDEIIAFKNDMAQHYQSRKALRTASHITLKAPFKLPAASHEQLLHWFGGMQVAVAPFVQEIKDFGAFNNRRNPVIYVQPVMNASLQQLQKEVLEQFRRLYPKETISKNEYHFSPHITIAYRDLQSDQFKEAWNVYQKKQYTASFEVNSFQLLQHTSGRWNVVGSCLLNHIKAEHHSL
jgi:2'-5' RNA ligase